MVNNQWFYLDIFLNPTFTDTVIPFNSNHPYNTKLSAFCSLINRLLRLPSNKEAFDKEFSTIYSIATGYTYETVIINNIIRKVKFKQLDNKLYTSYCNKEPKKLRQLPCFLNSPKSFKINNIFLKNMVSLWLSTLKTLLNG